MRYYLSRLLCCGWTAPQERSFGKDWETLHNLLQHQEVSGLGEIGEDHTMPISTWTDQTNEIDGAIRPADNLPRIVVLHCRGVQNKVSKGAKTIQRLIIFF